MKLATGFLGKVLVEKLLWSCPDIGTVFINVRSKQDCSVQERVDEIIKSPVFDRIREKKPSQLKKLVAMEGDITEDNLGLSQQDLEVFFNEVNVVFHSAASIRFNDPIQEAIKNNSLPTKRLIAMAHKMKRLEVRLCLLSINFTLKISHTGVNLRIDGFFQLVSPWDARSSLSATVRFKRYLRADSITAR